MRKFSQHLLPNNLSFLIICGVTFIISCHLIYLGLSLNSVLFHGLLMFDFISLQHDFSWALYAFTLVIFFSARKITTSLKTDKKTSQACKMNLRRGSPAGFSVGSAFWWYVPALWTAFALVHHKCQGLLAESKAQFTFQESPHLSSF